MDEQHYYQTAGHAVAAGIGLSSLATGAVICRFQAQSLRKQALKTDDWLLLPALVCYYRPTWLSHWYWGWFQRAESACSF